MLQSHNVERRQTTLLEGFCAKPPVCPMTHSACLFVASDPGSPGIWNSGSLTFDLLMYLAIRSHMLCRYS